VSHKHFSVVNDLSFHQIRTDYRPWQLVGRNCENILREDAEIG